MPLALDLSHKLLQELAILRRENNEIYVQMLNPK
jgi:S-adenosylmethionine synthetase